MTWDEAKQKIESLASFEEDWDSYGATSIVPGAISKALEILDVLREAGYPCPNVMPMNAGGVTLEWDSEDDAGSWEITIEAVE